MVLPSMNPTRNPFVVSFLDELHRAEAGHESSLSWISVPLIAVHDPCEFEYSITIGGTNVIIYKQGLESESIVINCLPSFRELVEQICESIPRSTTSINVNLAYPVEQKVVEGGITAIMSRNVKGHNFEDGFGAEIHTIFQQHLPELKEFQILNDTLLLVWRNYQEKNSNAGLVLGTGFNIGLIKNKEIINLECGNFDKFDPANTTLMIDSVSNNPGKQLLEKELGGKYLFQHYNLLTGESLDSTADMAKIIDEDSLCLWDHARERVKWVQTAIEDFLLPMPTVWSYEGSVIKFLQK